MLSSVLVFTCVVQKTVVLKCQCVKIVYVEFEKKGHIYYLFLIIFHCAVAGQLSIFSFLLLFLLRDRERVETIDSI
jgi:hypothetical protein